MSLISLIVTLAIVGVILWAVITYIPMEPTIRKILIIAVVVIVVFWLLQSLGLLANFQMIRVGN